VGGTNYAIKQVMATNDAWGIFGNSVAIDQGELVFEVSDNGASFNPAGQRFRFHYEASSSGTNKDPFILDYNLALFTTAIGTNHVHTGLTGTVNPYGEQISVTNTFNAGITWTALLACFNTSSLQTNNWNGSATFGNGSYTTNNLNLSNITFNAAGSTITNTQASGGIRAWANQILQLRIDGSNNGTYTHYANSAVYGDYASSTARLVITNRYGYLVNNLDEYSAGHTYTNRWAFYNAGINDNNFFAGKVGIGSGYVPSTFQLEVIGTAKINSVFQVNSNTLSFGSDATSPPYMYVKKQDLPGVNNSGRFLAWEASSTNLFTGINSAAFSFISADASTITSDVYNHVLISKNFSPTSSNGVFNVLRIATTINQGSAIGISRGIYLNPTLTSAADFRAIEISSGGVYVNTTSVAASAILQADSITKGFLPPRLTTTQKNAITSPSAGLIVYDSTLNKLCVFTTTWETITSI
jgi:hypothetical protein